MSSRAIVLALGILLATTAGAANRLVSGEEIPVGRYERMLPMQSGARPAMASDGETILAVHMGPEFYNNGLFVTRFDRSGKLLTPEPIPIVTRTETFGAAGHTPLKVIWFRDRYLVFFVDVDGKVNAVRVAADGTPGERVVLPFDGSSFDVATDGSEIVLVNTGSRLLRLGASLEVLGTMDLVPDQYGARARAVAFGDGRFLILTVRSGGLVTSQPFENGVLGPDVRLGTTQVEYWSTAALIWTGATFAGAWTDCDDRTLVDCVGIWMRMAPNGTIAGAMHVLGYRSAASSYEAYDLTMTALDAETLLFTWAGNDKQPMGRKYRVTGAAAGDEVSFGATLVSPFVTSGGDLMVLDGRQRMAFIEAAASAVFPPAMQYAPTILETPSDILLAAAASATEAAVLRRVPRDGGPANTVEVNVLAHDGTPLRDVPLDASNVYAGAIASDGRDFFALTSDWYGGLTFHDLRTGRKRRLSEHGYDPFMVWSGTELLAVWQENGERLWMTSLDREGLPLAPPQTLELSVKLLSMTANRGRVLLAKAKSTTSFVSVFDAHGVRIGAPHEFPDTNPSSGIGLATSGEIDAVATVFRDSTDLKVWFRPANGTLVQAPAWPQSPATTVYPALAPAGPTNFILAYKFSKRVLDTMNVALLDLQGHPSHAFSFVAGDGTAPILLELAPNKVLFLYSRTSDDARHAGATRTFARVLTVEEDVPGGMRGAHRQ